MYKCNECGEVFTTPVEADDYQLYAEPFDACPKCMSERITAFEPCPICGTGERMKNIPICHECALNELEAMEREGKMFGGLGRGALLSLLRGQI